MGENGERFLAARDGPIVICTLAMSLLMSGHLVWWLMEKKRNKHMFPSNYLDGVDDGIWWSFVTMTTGIIAICCLSEHDHYCRNSLYIMLLLVCP